MEIGSSPSSISDDNARNQSPPTRALGAGRHGAGSSESVVKLCSTLTSKQVTNGRREAVRSLNGQGYRYHLFVAETAEGSLGIEDLKRSIQTFHALPNRPASAGGSIFFFFFFCMHDRVRIAGKLATGALHLYGNWLHDNRSSCDIKFLRKIKKEAEALHPHLFRRWICAMVKSNHLRQRL